MSAAPWIAPPRPRIGAAGQVTSEQAPLVVLGDDDGYGAAGRSSSGVGCGVPEALSEQPDLEVAGEAEDGPVVLYRMRARVRQVVP